MLSFYTHEEFLNSYNVNLVTHGGIWQLKSRKLYMIFVHKSPKEYFCPFLRIQPTNTCNLQELIYQILSLGDLKFMVAKK